MRHRSSLLGGGFLAVGLLFALGVRTGWIDLTPVVCLVVECPEEDGLDFQSLPEGVPAVAGTSAPTPADPPFTLLTQLNRQGGQFSISPAGQFIRESGVLTAAVNDLNEQLTLDRTVPIIVGRACGEVNAFYDPNQREIVFCDEMFGMLSRLFARYEGGAFEDAVLGATLFFVMHEVGHALVHAYDLSTYGGEEDAADAIAAYLLTRNGASQRAFDGAASFQYMALTRAEQNLAFPLWDVHSPDERRFYNLVCTLYGAEPERYAAVARAFLPDLRAQGCADEYARLQRHMERDLGPHLRR